MDLGSNSFHVVVAHVDGGRIAIIDRIREMVRLAGGLDADNRLRDDVMERALHALRRFGQRLRHIPPGNVRVVGTNTLRKARNRDAFLERARQALGHEIEIISGREEARLIYLGVSQTLEDSGDRRLVMDIGGGSTEIILGRRLRPEIMESLYMGCVGLSQQYFESGRIRKDAYRSAVLHALRELEPVQEEFRRAGHDSAIGASGTIIAARDAAVAARGAGDAVTPAALARVEQQMLDAGHVDDLGGLGVSRQRAPVFPGGLAILRALFDALGIERLDVSMGALREGLLHDLLGRSRHGDIRETTVADLVRRYHVDQAHARRTCDTALQLLVDVALTWHLDVTRCEPLLRWAALLHEVGLDIAHTQYHRHGGYLLENMDMPGFSRSDQRRLAFLVRAHRRRFPMALLDEFPAIERDELKRLAMLLRLSVVLHRARSDDAPPLFHVTASTQSLMLVLPPGFLAEHPLTALDLHEEAGNVSVTGIALAFGERAE